MRCIYCLDSAPLIIHRDSHWISHLAGADCKNAPVDIRTDARRKLMKGGIEVAERDSDVEGDCGNGRPGLTRLCFNRSKKSKVFGSSVSTRRDLL